ncbi:MAG: TIGR04219 family outer membrane beta-barrel protein [Gammaproteobacteria bacterium]
MKKSCFALALVAACASSAATADTLLGIYAGAGSIDFDTSGTFRDLQDEGTEIDLEDDLGLSGDTGNYYYLALEHGIPVLPNIKLARTELDESSRYALSREITFDGITFPANATVISDMDLSHTDLTFYYEVMDNWLNLDLGFTARKFDGGFQSQASQGGTTVTASIDLDFTAPLLYAKAQIDLPLTGLYVGADVNWIGYSGSSFHDVWARVGYVFGFGLGVEAGYRQLKLDVDDIDDLEANVTVDGNYIAATFHF